MIVMLHTQRLKSLDDVRSFLAGSQAVDIKTPERDAAYAFIAQTLRRLDASATGA
jgi:hypothetical protein